MSPKRDDTTRVLSQDIITSVNSYLFLTKYRDSQQANQHHRLLAQPSFSRFSNRKWKPYGLQQHQHLHQSSLTPIATWTRLTSVGLMRYPGSSKLLLPKVVISIRHLRFSSRNASTCCFPTSHDYVTSRSKVAVFHYLRRLPWLCHASRNQGWIRLK